MPLHVSATSQTSPAEAARQTVPAGLTPSGGQLGLLPVHTSATSQASPVEAVRHTIPALRNVQPEVQQDAAVPFATPWSQASPLSTTPLPHRASAAPLQAANNASTTTEHSATLRALLFIGPPLRRVNERPNDDWPQCPLCGRFTEAVMVKSRSNRSPPHLLP
jgi:hypothetical protein